MHPITSSQWNYYTVTFSLAKSTEDRSGGQSTSAEASGSKSEVKEEVEFDPELSAVPPPSMKCELECKQEEGFVRPKPLNIKYVYTMHDNTCITTHADLWRKMFLKVSVLK